MTEKRHCTTQNSSDHQTASVNKKTVQKQDSGAMDSKHTALRPVGLDNEQPHVGSVGMEPNFEVPETFMRKILEQEFEQESRLRVYASDDAKKNNPGCEPDVANDDENDERPKRGLVAEQIKLLENAFAGGVNGVDFGVKPPVTAVNRLTDGMEDGRDSVLLGTVASRREMFEQLSKDVATWWTREESNRKARLIEQLKKGTSGLAGQAGVFSSTTNKNCRQFHQGKAPEVVTGSGVSLTGSSGAEGAKPEQAGSSRTDHGTREDDGTSDTAGNGQIAEPHDEGWADHGDGGCEANGEQDPEPSVELECEPIFHSAEVNRSVKQNEAHSETGSASASVLQSGSQQILRKNYDNTSEFKKAKSEVVKLLMELLVAATEVSEQNILMKLMSIFCDVDTMLPRDVMRSLMAKLIKSRQAKSLMEQQLVDSLPFSIPNRLLVLEVVPSSLLDSLSHINRTAFTWHWLITGGNPTNDAEAEVNEILRHNQDITQVPSVADPVVRMESDESAGDVSKNPEPFSPTIDGEMVDDGGPVVEQ